MRTIKFRNRFGSTRFFKLSLGLSIIAFGTCTQYDPKLMTPDSSGKGYNLTPLGCLVQGPWEADFDRHNVSIVVEGKEISSFPSPYSDRDKNLVFELMQDGSVNYWFKYRVEKKAHLEANNEPSTNAKNYRSKIYTGGVWKANFKDSSLTIDFGNNELGLKVLSGKYGQLGSGSLYFKQIKYMDSFYNGKLTKYTKLISTIYKHPYLHDFNR